MPNRMLIMSKRAGPYVVDWGKVLEESYVQWQQDNRSQHEETSHKRSASTTASKTVKKAKLDQDGGGVTGIDDADMEMKFAKCKISSLTVAQLKDYIADKKLGSVTGLRKPDLIAMVEGHFEKKKGR